MPSYHRWINWSGHTDCQRGIPCVRPCASFALTLMQNPNHKCVFSFARVSLLMGFNQSYACVMYNSAKRWICLRSSVILTSNVADGEAELLVSTKGRTVPLAPSASAASGDSSDSIDKLFEEGNDAEQERSTERGDDVLEETIAKDVPEIVVEKTKKKRKGKAVADASGSTHPPKRLREDFHAATSDIGRKSLAAIRGLIPKDSSVSELNLRTRPLIARSSIADVPVVTVVATTTVAVDVSTILHPPVRVVFESPTSVGGAKKNVTNDSVLDDPYVCRDLTDRLAPPAFFSQLRAMDYDQLYAEFNVGAARQMCLRAEVRMRAEHTLEQKNRLEDKCSEQSVYLSEKDAEIAYLRSLLSLKESEAAEAIRLREQVSVVEAVDAVKGNELRDLKERNFALEGEKNILSEKITTLESFSCDEVNSKVVSLESEKGGLINQISSLESAFKLFKQQIEAMQDEQATALRNRAIGCAINKGILDGLKVGVDHGKARRDLSVIKDYDPSLDILKLLETMSRFRKDNVPLGETSLSFSLQVVHSRVQRVRGEIKDKCLSLIDVMVPLIKPLSSKSLIGEASTSATPATAEPITTLSTTLAPFDVVPPLPVPDYRVLDTEPHGGDPSSTA
ncbi:hypothetical protein Tco_0580372 [Tanacetum coccineum]